MNKHSIIDFYNLLNLIKKNDEEIEIFFEKYSDIYVDEFFMFFSIKCILDDDQIITPIEISNILQDLSHNTFIFDKLKKLSYKYNHNYFYYTFINANNNELKIEQEKLKRYMNKIFNHDMISQFIEEINLNIIYYSKNISIKIFNNIYIDKLIELLKDKLNIKNDIYIKYNKNILNNTKQLY
jgi:hypothetical protein